MIVDIQTEEQYMEEYLLIYYSETSKRSIGLTLDGTFQALQGKPVEIFRQWCNQAGTSLEGRLDCFKKLTGTRQKPSIYVGGVPPVIFVPTTSMKKLECIYLRADQIEKVKSSGLMTEVTFHQKITYKIPVSARNLRQRVRLSMEYVNNLRYPG